MTEFIPSETFVEQVMKEVREHHEAETRWQKRMEKLVSVLSVRIIMTGGATAIGAWNLFRIYLSLFSPILCK